MEKSKLHQVEATTWWWYMERACHPFSDDSWEHTFYTFFGPPSTITGTWKPVWVAKQAGFVFRSIYCNTLCNFDNSIKQTTTCYCNCEFAAHWLNFPLSGILRLEVLSVFPHEFICCVHHTCWLDRRDMMNDWAWHGEFQSVKIFVLRIGQCVTFCQNP